MKIGLFVHKIHQFEPDTGKNTQDRCDMSWQYFCCILGHIPDSFSSQNVDISKLRASIAQGCLATCF